eukprot:2436725-Alexandrium_andersonii.AAC.1
MPAVTARVGLVFQGRGLAVVLRTPRGNNDDCRSGLMQNMCFICNRNAEHCSESRWTHKLYMHAARNQEHANQWDTTSNT